MLLDFFNSKTVQTTLIFLSVIFLFSFEDNDTTIESKKENKTPTQIETSTVQPTPTETQTPTETPTEQNNVVYSVVEVVDGDTVKVEKDGEKITLRLIGLDTPETKDPRKPVQCFGEEAYQKARELLEGKTVTLELDSSQGTTDKYGRTLAYVFLQNGELYNKKMIADGYAFEYTYNTPYKYQREFKDAERIAREQNLGLWSEATCNGEKGKPKEEPTKEPTKEERTLQTDNCECKTCKAIKSCKEAKRLLNECGCYKLDKDDDGIPCESLCRIKVGIIQPMYQKNHTVNPFSSPYFSSPYFSDFSLSIYSHSLGTNHSVPIFFDPAIE